MLTKVSNGASCSPLYWNLHRKEVSTSRAVSVRGCGGPGQAVVSVKWGAGAGGRLRLGAAR